MLPHGGSKTQNGRFTSKIALLWKKVCYKVSSCENSQRQSCKAFIGLSQNSLSSVARVVCQRGDWTDVGPLLRPLRWLKWGNKWNTRCRSQDIIYIVAGIPDGATPDSGPSRSPAIHLHVQSSAAILFVNTQTTARLLLSWIHCQLMPVCANPARYISNSTWKRFLFN